jgi:hypothetical protein
MRQRYDTCIQWHSAIGSKANACHEICRKTRCDYGLHAAAAFQPFAGKRQF